MPGLPRKSTKNQFSKLMKKSGKSKTNTKSGAYDTSKIKISTKEDLVIKFNDFKIFESEENSLSVYYEIINTDEKGQERVISIDDNKYNYNPYSLKESVNMLLIYRDKYRNSPRINLSLRKVTRTKVDEEVIEKVKIEIEADKYNL
jgi:hypothetical protein